MAAGCWWWSSGRLVLFLAGWAFAPDDALALRLTGSFAAIASGLEVAEGTVAFDEDAVRVPLTLVRVDPALHGVRIATPADLPPAPSGRAAARGYTLRGYFERLGAVAVLAGGLLASIEPPEPLGLVISGGRVVSPPHRSWGSSGLFCTGPAGASIRRFEPSSVAAAATDSAAEDCLQSGPLLVGPEGVASADRLRRAIGVDYTRDFVEGQHPRSFVALDRRGRVLLGVTGPLSLPRLAEILAAAAGPEVLDVAAALNLTGAETAGLLARTDEVEVEAGDVDGVALPNAVVVLARPGAFAPNPEPDRRLSSPAG